ncbi:hypothetical protein, partial [Mycobacteroides abscessus]|uniref:hypothetical protein n=1 Tax=Mycobacteroides abscessus TaxID=36809 RepID=UPI003CF63A4E
MSLVDYQNIKGITLSSLRVRGLGVDIAQETLRANLRQPGHADDNSGIELERVSVQPMGAAHLRHQLGVD